MADRAVPLGGEAFRASRTHSSGITAQLEDGILHGRVRPGDRLERDLSKV